MPEYRRALAGRPAADARLDNPFSTSLLGLAALPFFLTGCDSGGGGGGGDSGIPDAGAGGDSGVGGSDGGTPGPQTMGAPSVHDTIPCTNNGFIADLGNSFGTCGDFSSNYHLFSWNPAMAGALTSLASTTNDLYQVLRSTSGDYYITNIGDLQLMPPKPAGLTRMIPGTGLQAPVAFPTLNLPSAMPASNGAMVSSLQPAYARGLVEVENRIFVALQNQVPNPANLSQSYFNPGAVAVFDRTTGTVTGYIVTSDFNPNSIAYSNNRIYVVNSGDINPFRVPAITTPSSIDVIDPNTQTIVRNIPLGNIGAGSWGEVGVSADGHTMVLNSGDGSGRILVVDLDSGDSRQINVASGSARLTGCSLDATGRYAFVGNEANGTVYMVDLTTDTVVDSEVVDSNLGDFISITHVLPLGLNLFVSVGNQIVRVPLVSE